MMLESGAKHVIAIEPSEGFEALKQNVSDKERVTLLKITGDKIPADSNLDYVFSIGVLHHIPDPKPVVKSAFQALKPGGKFLIWVYGKEGNHAYLFFISLLRWFTKRIPHSLLVILVWMLYVPFFVYMHLCHFISLPLRGYLLAVFEKMAPDKRRLIIYDQLNPAYAKYYKKEEVENLLSEANFKDIKLHHRHGYSWTAVGKKP
jgi:SAM-dependent methyltransferase